MKRTFLGILIILIIFIGIVLADPNEVPSPSPVVLSFQGGHAYGENPVEIVDNQTGYCLIINTSSKLIEVPSEGTFKIRVEPAGLSDAANSPDSSLSGLLGYVKKYPIGTVAVVLVIAIGIGVFLGRKNEL